MRSAAIREADVADVLLVTRHGAIPLAGRRPSLPDHWNADPPGLSCMRVSLVLPLDQATTFGEGRGGVRKPGEPAATDGPSAFAIERAPFEAPGVLVRGEVDLATAPTLTEEIDAAMRDSAGAFVVDLCDVEFLDSTGVTVLLHARAFLARDERDLVVVCPPGPVLRIFEMAGIDDLFTIFDTRDEAAGSLQPIASAVERP